jgi:hypothetical protein
LAGLGRRFEKGRQKTGGRVKGSKNVLQYTAKEFLKGLADDPKAQAKYRAKALRGSEKAYQFAVEQSYGKAKQVSEVSGPGGGPIETLEVTRKIIHAEEPDDRDA